MKYALRIHLFGLRGYLALTCVLSLIGATALPLMAALGQQEFWEGMLPDGYEQDDANYGYSVASAGDVNGDGYDDVIVGAYLMDDWLVDCGAAFLYLGGQEGLVGPVWFSFGEQQAGAQFGWSVAAAGDVNADGYGDLIVGANLHDYAGHTDSGMAYLFLGSAEGLAEQPEWTYQEEFDGAQLGSQVASAGDVNKDGFDDVIVGAARYTSGQNLEGAAFVFLGNEGGLESEPVWQVEGNLEFAVLGTSVAGAGDVNGDGWDDVIIGAPQYAFTYAAEGRAFVYLGTSSGVDTVAAWAFSPGQWNARFGRSVTGAGDVNGDGYDDVVVGAYRYTATLPDPRGEITYSAAGRAWAFHGNQNGVDASASWSSGVAQEFAFYGISVASAGDTNNDGFDDLLVGASSFTNDQADEGRAYLYAGSATGLSTGPVWYKEGNQEGAQFGLCVAPAGDINGDLLADVVIGAPGYDEYSPNQGKVLAYLGVE